MCPEPRPPPRTQGGFAIVAAVFLVVVAAGLAIYITSISAAQQSGAALDALGGRALLAARSGMDWGVARVIAAPTAFGTGNCQAAIATPLRINLSTGTGGTLAAHGDSLTVTVSCQATPATDGASLISYDLKVTACNQPSATFCPNTTAPGSDYIERQLSTQIVCNAAGPC